MSDTSDVITAARYIRREKRIDVTGVSLLFPSVNFLIARDSATRHITSS